VADAKRDIGMEISSNRNSYVHHQISDDYLSKIKQGETIEATPYTGTAFDNVSPNPPPLRSYTSHGYYGKDTASVNISEKLTSLINAKKENHTLQSYELTDRNIELYENSMLDHADEHITQSTVSVGGFFVALETNWDQLSRPFHGNAPTNFELAELAKELYYKVDNSPSNKAKLESFLDSDGRMSHNIADQLFAESGGDFSVFVEKLEGVFGDLVSVEKFSEGEGPTYAESHLLLNNSTFEDFVTSQTDRMHKVKSYYESFDEELAKQRVLGGSTYNTLQLTESDYKALQRTGNNSGPFMKVYDEISKIS